MKKISTMTPHEIGKLAGQRLTIGLDLGDRSSYYCVLDEAGRVLLEERVSTTPKAMKAVFGGPYLRTLLVQGAHHILGPFGADSELRRWGLKV